MCDLTTMALVAGIAATAISGVGSIQQGMAANQAAKYNAQVGEMNATLSERRAKDALERGQDAEQAHRMKVNRLIGEQTVGMAAGGVDVSFGSPLDTISDTATMGELDALRIRTNANREAYDFEVDAVNQRAGSALSLSKGRSARTGGFLDAGGTLLGGAGQAALTARDL